MGLLYLHLLLTLNMSVAIPHLKTGHDRVAVHLRKIGTYESSDCTICRMPDTTMDEEHLLYCPELDTNQQVLKDTTKLYCVARAMLR